MRAKITVLCLVVGVVLTAAGVGRAADVYGLEPGTPDLQSAGQLAFAPDGILLVGDTRGTAVLAIATDDKSGNREEARINVHNLGEQLGRELGANPSDVTINDLAVNPASGNVYLSATVDGSQPALVKITTDGRISRMSLENVAFSKAALPNPPQDREVQRGRRRMNPRDSAITDLAFVDGQILVSGLSDSGEAPSSVRTLQFPFSDYNQGASLEIYHGAHGRVEDDAPVRTFVPFVIDGKPNLLAGFTCTPLVKFPLDDVARSSKVKGTTVAELGNRNTPLDMIVYQQDGQDFILIANDRRGVMKVNAANVANQEGIQERVEGGGRAGLPYETIDELQNVTQLDRLNDDSAIVLMQTDSSLSLQTVPLP